MNARLSLLPSRIARLAPYIAALVAVLAYVPALGHGFAYDDVPIIVENEALRSAGRLVRLLGQPYWQGDGILYRPLPMMSYWVDWRVADGAPWPFHVQNVLWHALVVALVTQLARRWLNWRVALGAGIAFAVHPMHVEAVASIVGRADLLAAAMLLLVTLLCSSGSESAGRRGAVVGLAFLAMSSKEIGVVAPIIAWGAARLAGGPEGSVRRWTIAAATGVALAIVLRMAVLGSLASHPPHPAFASATRVEALLLALATLPRAVLLSLVPMAPAPDHSPAAAAIATPSWVLVVAGVLMIAGAAWLLVHHARRPSPASLAAAIAIVTFAPVSNVVLRTGVVLGERTLYAPSIGAVLLLALGAAWSWPRWPRLTTAAGTVWIAAAAWLTFDALPIWRSTDSVIAAMVDRAPTSYWGHYHAGRIRLAHGDLEGAAIRFARARALFAGDPNVALDAGSVALRLGRRDDAVALLEEAVRLAPGNERARALLDGVRRSPGS